MGDDIVTRLRHMAWTAEEGAPYADALKDAADEITRLRQKIGDLRAEAEQDDETITRLRALVDVRKSAEAMTETPANVRKSTESQADRD